MRQSIISYLFVFVLGLLPIAAVAASYEIKEISLMSINSAITPATYDYLKQNIKSLPENSLILLKMNTPGGLITTTKDIITLFGNEQRPVAVWITPEGASASSAGAIIASAAHFIFMSPGTNMGAATPVGLGEDLKEGDGRKKAMNDLTALVRSLSHSRGRPSVPFEQMITGAESFTDAEAQKLGILNGVISKEEEIISLIQGKRIILGGVEHTIQINNPPLKIYEPSIGQKILEVLTNPSTAYFLFLIGVALLYIELQAPGGYVAGSFGVCFLILAGIAFQILPLDWGSMGLILLGIGFLVLEVFVTSYGLLAIVGVTAFVMGSLFLFHGEAGLISIEYSVIISTLLGVFSALALIVWYLWKDRKKQSLDRDFFLPLGSQGTVLTKGENLHYQVKVRGEIWNATSEDHLDLGDLVEVIHIDPKKLFIQIKKKSN